MDLLPGYREMAPPAVLRAVVACLWVRVLDSRREVRVVPDGCIDLVWRRGLGVIVAGADTVAKVDEYRRGDVLAGIRFVPGAGGGVLGVPVHELRDMRVDAVEVDRAFALDGDLAPAEVLERLAAATVGRAAVDAVVIEAVRRIGLAPLSTVARELFLSERQLRRRFHTAVGYGPATLARVMRFGRFVREVDSGRGDLAALALEAGYADQAHLTRETNRLAGLAPWAFIRARRGEESPNAGP